MTRAATHQAPRGPRPLAALSIAWALAVGGVAVSLANCSVDHRSQEFACSLQSDCTGGRTCVDGFCVFDGSGSGSGSGSNTVDAGTPDARADASMPPDAAVCPSICTSCDFGNGTCNIDCAQTNACSNGNPINCPAGFNCVIDCSTQFSCRTVNCQNAASCTVSCSGGGSCRTVSCGAGACNVDCSGFGACRNPVACNNSCKCDVACGGQQSCQNGSICTHNVCDNNQGGCDSTLDPVCNTCP